MTISSLYSCGIFCNHQGNYDGIRASNLKFRANFFNRLETSITFAVAIVIHKSRNLIGTLGIAVFGPMALKSYCRFKYSHSLAFISCF